LPAPWPERRLTWPNVPGTFPQWAQFHCLEFGPAGTTPASPIHHRSYGLAAIQGFEAVREAGDQTGLDVLACRLRGLRRRFAVRALPCLLGIGTSAVTGTPACGQLWAPDHIVVVVLENRDLDQVVGSTQCPFINTRLIPEGALLRNSLAIGHPSQPNYLELFSGSPQMTQGSDGPVPGSLAPAGAPGTGPGLDAPNLGAATIAAGRTFAGYAEGLQLAGDPLAYAGGGRSRLLYVRKHNPWSNFIARAPAGQQLPADVNRDFSSFPANDFMRLPALSFVIPNQCHDAHGTAADCPDGDANLAAADRWLEDHLYGYAQWAKAHNSLLILTTDEGEVAVGRDPATGLELTRITTVLVGGRIRPGDYQRRIDVYGLCALIALVENAAPPAACGQPAALAEARGLADAVMLSE